MGFSLCETYPSSLSINKLLGFGFGIWDDDDSAQQIRKIRPDPRHHKNIIKIKSDQIGPSMIAERW